MGECYRVCRKCTWSLPCRTSSVLESKKHLDYAPLCWTRWQKRDNCHRLELMCNTLCPESECPFPCLMLLICTSIVYCSTIRSRRLCSTLPSSHHMARINASALQASDETSEKIPFILQPIQLEMSAARNMIAPRRREIARELKLRQQLPEVFRIHS